MFLGMANSMKPFSNLCDQQGCQFFLTGLPDRQFLPCFRVLFITLVLINVEKWFSDNIHVLKIYEPIEETLFQHFELAGLPVTGLPIPNFHHIVAFYA